MAQSLICNPPALYIVDEVVHIHRVIILYYPVDLKMTFRISSKNFALTWPQCPIDKDLAKAHLLTLGTPTYVLVCHELHEDGSPHLHALVQYSKRKDVKSPTYFDLSHDGTVYHGDYKLAKDDGWKTYVEKDGDTTEEGAYEPMGKKGGKSTRDGVYAEALASGSIEAAYAIVQAGCPRDWVMHGANIRANIDFVFATHREEYVPLFETFGSLPPLLGDWQGLNLMVRVIRCARLFITSTLRCRGPNIISLIAPGYAY